MKFDKHGIVKIPPKESCGVSLGLVGAFIGASVGLMIGTEIFSRASQGEQERRTE